MLHGLYMRYFYVTQNNIRQPSQQKCHIWMNFPFNTVLFFYIRSTDLRLKGKHVCFSSSQPQLPTYFDMSSSCGALHKTGLLYVEDNEEMT